MGYRLGVDIGGTFTDFVLAHPNGRLSEAKVASRPDEPGEALREGIQLLADELDVSVQDLLQACDVLIHGTTVATNALIQQRGARTGILCTEGFRDTLQMRDGYKEKRYDFGYPPPPVLVPRYLRLPVRERVGRDGTVLIPLHEDDIYRNVKLLAQHAVEAIAVCFLWSFLNPDHERRCGEIIQNELPEVYLSLSAEVLPEVRHFDRLSTTVINSFLGPVMVRYVDNVENVLRSLGYTKAIRYTQCNGGVASGEIIKRKPVMALDSGPAAAPAAGQFFGSMVETQDVLTVDMGGTSFDVCLIDKGSPATIKNVDLQRYRVGIPMVEVNAIGAGGGSIATLDSGLLRVGPESAEAVPGPACYDTGGTEPTITDADVVLGYLNPRSLLGGRFPIYKEKAERAIQAKLAEPLGIATERAAYAMFVLVNQNMVNAIREVSVERGYDPRDFTLIVAGGCGPVHGASIARELGITTVLIPQIASTFCAFGAIVAHIRHDYGTSYVSRFGKVDVERLNDLFDQMERQGFDALSEEGIFEDRRTAIRFAEMRYLHQIHECTVEVPGGRLTDKALSELERLFHQKHEALYTYSEPDEEIELINCRVAVVGETSPIKLTASTNGGRAAGTETVAEPASRPVLFDGVDGFQRTPVYGGQNVKVGKQLEGPAIIEEAHTTIVVPPKARVILDPRGMYVMVLEPGTGDLRS